MSRIPCFLNLLLLLPLAVRADNVGPQAGQKVAFLGDSITFNGWIHPAGYVQLVAKAMELQGRKIEVIPAGIGGNTSKDMAGRVKGILDQKPDWMTLSCGVNDVFRGANGGIALDEYQKNITAIVDQATAAGVKVVILTATLIGEDPANANNQKLAAYNDFLRSLAKERQLLLADLNAAEQAALIKIRTDWPNGKGVLLTDDGIHMNGFGDQMMATGILQTFGFTDAQIASIKSTWDTMPAAMRLNTPTALSIEQFRKLSALATSQGKQPADLINDLVQKNLPALLDTPVPPSALAPVPAPATPTP
jgi:lysophospholipase L1-like esterase